MSKTDAEKRPLIDRASFFHWDRLQIRWGDMDAMGHVNNAVIATYFEQSRIGIITPLLARFAHPNLNIVLARTTIDYLREFHYPGSAEIGTRLAHVGGRSFRFESGAFIGPVCVATCSATAVFFDTAMRRSAEPPDDVRAALLALAGPG
jgi:acyl-CoA thioester hydrolase